MWRDTAVERESKEKGESLMKLKDRSDVVAIAENVRRGLGAMASRRERNGTNAEFWGNNDLATALCTRRPLRKTNVARPSATPPRP